jgi:hypothetical protein
MAADDPSPVLATSGLHFSSVIVPLAPSGLNVIEENGGNKRNTSGVRGRPRASI